MCNKEVRWLLISLWFPRFPNSQQHEIKYEMIKTNTIAKFKSEIKLPTNNEMEHKCTMVSNADSIGFWAPWLEISKDQQQLNSCRVIGAELIFPGEGTPKPGRELRVRSMGGALSEERSWSFIVVVLIMTFAWDKNVIWNSGSGEAGGHRSCIMNWNYQATLQLCNTCS